MLSNLLTMMSGADGADALAQRVISRLSTAELEWISINRDWAENERYRLKDQVDESLLASDHVNERREAIEHLFCVGSEAEPEVSYLRLLEQDFAHLHGICRAILQTELQNNWSLNVATDYWRSFVAAADVDNAHAMYLSSGNWPFSVFDRLVNYLRAAPVAPPIYSTLLTGDVRDIRTTVYELEILSSLLPVTDRRRFANRVQELPGACEPNGVMPIFLYEILSSPRASSIVVPNTDAYTEAVSELLAVSAHPLEAQRCLKLYRALHTDRLAYETYQ
jgi:hypothetical protein